LLAELSGVLDFRAGDRVRLIELLAGDEDDLIENLGGSRKAELRAAVAGLRGDDPTAGAPAVCRHDPAFPSSLRAPGSPRMLHLMGSSGSLCARASPAVTLCGSQRPSDYGIEMARGLARAAAASCVRIVTVLLDGIARAARMAAAEGGGARVIVSGGGFAPAGQHRARRLPALLAEGGCAVAELPPGCSGRRWGRIAAERTAVELSDLVIVVEAEESPADLFVAELARSRGRPLAAVPGKSTSHLARGPLALLRDGATLVRDGDDVLELLDRQGTPGDRSARASSGSRLPRRLRLVLEEVGAGRDTPHQLLAGGDPAGALVALTELELMGRIRRGRGGRYTVCTRPA
jgi:DNA processing protein